MSLSLESKLKDIVEHYECATSAKLENDVRRQFKFIFLVISDDDDDEKNAHRLNA